MHFMVKIRKGGRTADTRAREVESRRCKLTGIPNRIKRKYKPLHIIRQSPRYKMNFPVSIMSMKSHLISTLSEFVSFQIQAGFHFLAEQ